MSKSVSIYSLVNFVLNSIVNKNKRIYFENCLPEPETCFDNIIKDCLLTSIDELMKEIYFEMNCIIYSLALIDKLTKISKLFIPLTSKNYMSVFLGSLIVSQKILYDNPISNSLFAKELEVSVIDLNSIELLFVNNIDFRVKVSNEEFDKYRELLNSLCSS